jgi:hypothetical protein
VRSLDKKEGERKKGEGRRKSLAMKKIERKNEIHTSFCRRSDT